MIKKIMAITLVFCFLTVNAFASVVEFSIGETSFVVENENNVTKKTVEAPPFIENGRTMVPIRAISEAFGTVPQWNEKEREVLIKMGESEIKLYIDNPTAYINGEKTELDVSPKIVNSRTFVPIRFISEALKYNVNYVRTTSQVVIDDTPVIVSSGDKTVTLAETKELYNLYKAVSPRGDWTDAEFEEAVFTTVMEEIARIALFSNAFSYFNYTEEELLAVKAGIMSAKEDYKSKMDALSSLVLEKFFLHGADLIVNHIATTENLEEVYKKNYVCAKHVLVKDEDTAQLVLGRAKNGADFDSLIKEFGQDTGMAENPNGYVFTKGEMVQEFETATFMLNEGEISGIVESGYGFHIIKKLPLPPLSDEIKINLAPELAMEKLAKVGMAEFKYTQEEIKKMIK